MKMKWKWKRPAAFLLAAAMIVTMSGVPASAVEAGVSAASGNAAASTEGTISGDVTWNNRTITTPVRLTGDTTITLSGNNFIAISDPNAISALEMDYRSLTIQGSGSLTVTVPDRKYGIADSGYSDSNGGTLTIKGGAEITTNGGTFGLSAKTIVIENGTLNLKNSGYGIDTASLTMSGGTLYTTGKYGAISNSQYGKARNINNNLTVLYSENQNANKDDMSVGTAADTTRDEEVKTHLHRQDGAPRKPDCRRAAGNPAGKLRPSDGDLLRYRQQGQDGYPERGIGGQTHRSDGGKIL